jgi:hypothetical protein
LLSARVPAMRNQALIGFTLFGVGIWLAYEIGGRIAAEDLRSMEFYALIFVGCVVAVATLRNWRHGFYMFLVWLLFEDLVRKYMGNGLVLFFGKDILVGIIYISLVVAIRKGSEKAFRPPFLLFLSFFVWLGVLQVFNQNSPSIFYGFLGFKLDFYYIPLMFVGYALIRSDEDLRKFLVANMILAGAIAALGLIQAIVGHTFLNPTILAPELRELGQLDKVTPISNQVFSLPAGVFVSNGRFALYLIVTLILAIGTGGYLLLSTKRNRILVFFVIGLTGAATFFTGSRGAVMYALISGLVLPAGFLWGAPWRWKQAHRLVKAIRHSFIIAALGLATVLLLFPGEAAPRIAFYAETLLPGSSSYALSNRAWDYPMANLMGAFNRPNWVVGNGIGTASLGTQYVAKLIGGRQLDLWVEEGYGQLIIEMGIIAPFLWLLWTAALLYHSWLVVRRLRQTRFFPIAFAIFWYAFILLYPLTYGGMMPYQNYINNAYLWLLVGVLFRLPEIQAAGPAPAAVPSGKLATRGGFEF